MDRVGKLAKKGLDSLKVWHRARELVVAVHKRVVLLLPPEEKWDLASRYGVPPRVWPPILLRATVANTTNRASISAMSPVVRWMRQSTTW
jgi:hypothetical protein